MKIPFRFWLSRTNAPHRSRAAITLLLVTAAIWGVSYYFIQNAEQSSITIANERSRLLSRGLAENVRTTIRLLDLAALQLADDWTKDPKQFAAQINRTRKKISDITLQVGAVDSEGFLTFSDLGLPNGPLSLKDREHVRVHLDSDRDELFISRPLKGRVSKKWSIQFTRPIHREGRNIGVIVLSVDPAYLARSHEALNLGESGIVAIVRSSGELITRAPGTQDFLGTIVREAPYLRKDAPFEGNFRRSSQNDGIERTYGYTRLPEYGFVVLAGISDKAAMGSYITQRNLIVTTASVLSLALLLAIIAIIRPLEVRARIALERAHASEESFQLLVNGVIDYAIIMLDPDGRISKWNAGAKRIKGYSKDEIIGKHYSCFFTPHDVANGLPERGLRIATEHGRFEDSGYRLGKSGLQFWANVVITAIRDSGGQLVGFALVTRDITELKKAQEEIERTDRQLREAQKLEGIGQLTGGLAHDFNNLLGIVVGNLDMIGEHLPDNERLRRQHKTALDAALRGAEVTRSLLAVARRQPLEVKECDINELLQEMLPLLRSSAGSAVTIKCELAPGKLLAMLDSGALNQLVLNLVINARDAMQDLAHEKTLTIRSSSRRIGEKDQADLTPGVYAMLEVTDVGKGMSETVRRQAFEPFFTTKERGRGTGLGLSMVYGYATQIGGTAVIESEEGKRTTVRIFIPLRASTGIDSPQKNIAKESTLGEDTGVARLPTRVLIVDDEPGLCELACTWVSSLGYTATAAHSPAEGLRLLGEGAYDVLFTDIVMPGKMDGLALAREALKRQPHISVLFASGYSGVLLEEKEQLGPVLPKPYRKQQLSQALAELLAKKKSHA